MVLALLGAGVALLAIIVPVLAAVAVYLADRFAVDVAERLNSSLARLESTDCDLRIPPLTASPTPVRHPADIATQEARPETLTSPGPWRVLAGHRTTPGRFERPHGLALDRRGNLYVSEAGNSRLQKLSSSGQPLAVWGKYGRAPGLFYVPMGVAVDTQDNVYVADAFNHRVQKLTANLWPVVHWGGEGSGPGQFRLPRGIAVDARGGIYVADTCNHRVQVLPAGQP